MITFAAQWSMLRCAVFYFRNGHMERQQIPTDTASLPKNGHSKTIHLSSNATLFWKIFVPFFGTVFLTGLVLAFLLIDADDLYLPVPVWAARLVMVALWLGWMYLIVRTIWRLKRVDADDTHVFVTDYWTTVRYPWQDIERFEEKKRMGRQVVNFHLKAPGRFGQIISFLPGSGFAEWKSRNEERPVEEPKA